MTIFKETVFAIISSLSDPKISSPTSVSGHESGLEVVEVAPDLTPPVRLEGSACVYALIISGGSGSDVVYVGETESILQRLRQHRYNQELTTRIAERSDEVEFQLTATNNANVACLQSGLGKESKFWSLISPVSNKSIARLVESRLIARLKKEGYVVQMGRDQHHLLFSRSI